MSININLVEKKDPEESKREKGRKLRGISFAILFTTAFLAILIFAIDYRFSASFVRKQEADALKDLEPFAESSSKIFIINSKLTDISNLITKRKKYNTTISMVLENKPDDLSIDEFTIDEKGTEMTLSSASLQPIDEFLNSILNLIKEKKISNVVLESLNVYKGKYIVVLSII